MKIAYIYDSVYPYNKGGLERRIWEFSTRLAQRGHVVHIFAPRFWEGDTHIVKEGVHLHGVCGAPRKRFVHGRRTIDEPMHFALRLVLPLLSGERFDIIDCPNFPYFPCYSAKLSSLLRRIPLVISWFEVWDRYWYEYLGKIGVFGQIIERLTVRLPQRMIVETAETKQALTRWGFRPGRIDIVPSGLNFNRIQTVAPPASGQDRADIIYVGRLVDYKGVHNIIAAVAHLKKMGKSVTASIVGDGPEREALKTLCRDLGVEPRIRFYGRVEEEERVISLMKGARAFIYAATPLGGWALTPLEANACGLPVISARSGSVGKNDVVSDGFNGLLTDGEAPELLAEKILLLTEDERLREKLRANALENARRFDWDNQTDLVERVYQDCLWARKKDTKVAAR